MNAKKREIELENFILEADLGTSEEDGGKRRKKNPSAAFQGN